MSMKDKIADAAFVCVMAVMLFGFMGWYSTENDALMGAMMDCQSAEFARLDADGRLDLTPELDRSVWSKCADEVSNELR